MFLRRLMRKLKKMKVRDFGFFFLFFPCFAFSLEALKDTSFDQKATEASFSFKCEKCQQNQTLALNEKKCLLKIKSKECQAISIKMDILCDFFISLVLSKRSVPSWARLGVTKEKQFKGIKKLFQNQSAQKK